jgi:hypothetical protein
VKNFPLLMAILVGCTEIVTEPHYYDSDTVYVYSDTTVITINIQVNAIVKILVTMPDGTPVNDVIMTVTTAEGWLGTMMYHWPGFDEDNYYRWVMVAPMPVTIFLQQPPLVSGVVAIDTYTGFRYPSKNWIDINTEDFKITRWHNITIKENDRWRFELIR